MRMCFTYKEMPKRGTIWWQVAQGTRKQSTKYMRMCFSSKKMPPLVVHKVWGTIWWQVAQALPRNSATPKHPDNTWKCVVQKNATSFRCNKVWGPIRWPETLPDPRHPARSLLLTTPTMTHKANYKVAMIKTIKDGRKKEESVNKKVERNMSEF